jgi:hypothetical protein
MHGSLVTSSLIRETTENESANEGYRFGQEEQFEICQKEYSDDRFLIRFLAYREKNGA